MTDSGAVPNTATRRTVAVAVCGLVFLCYWTLLTDGRFFQVRPVPYDLVFNSMLEHMAHGRFDVDPAVIRQEGFTRDGRTYAYFGVLPALLRLPILLSPRWRMVDFTALSCAIAATIATVAQLAAVLRAGRAIGAGIYRRRSLLFAAAMVIFGGAQLQFLRPSVYQESAFWAAALAALFVLLAFRWCVEPARRTPGHLAAMAVPAGLCLLTRVSTSIGLYAACGAIMLSEAIALYRGHAAGDAGRRAGGVLRAMLTPSLILLMFAAICGFINNARWGSPLTFQDYRYYDILTVNDPAYDVLIDYGYFNLRRIPFALLYFFVPVWAIIGSDGHFLFRALQDRLYYMVELPPASFFASDPLLLFLSLLGCAGLARGATLTTERWVARMVAVCLLIPGLVMLMAIALAFRYRMEFYPGLDFLALFGLLRLPAKIAARPRLVTGACGVLLAVSIGFAGLFLLAYKIAPWGDASSIEAIGWTAAWHKYLHITYPALDRLL